MVRVGIVNVTGYAGADTARILARHPEARLVGVTGRSAAGQPLAAVYPHLADLDLIVQDDLPDVDVAFSALPHHASAEAIPRLVEDGRRVVDISADYRLHDVGLYERWYGEHPSPGLLPEAPYGLPELHGVRIAMARLVANPGCYPTAANLALRPLVEAGVIERDAGIVCDAKSGVSGAGRKASLTTSFCEVTENFSAYAILEHRHVPEILSVSGLEERELSFTAQLLPLDRGILETIYFRAKDIGSAGDLLEIYQRRYADEPFVRLYSPGQVPDLRSVARTNFCDLGMRYDPATGRAVIVAAIDNLVKGAAGQAVQNMNLALGLPETEGLL